MRLKIIVNPVAGQGRARQATMTIKRLLYKTQIEFDLEETKREGEAMSMAAMAEEEGFDTVAVVGGDGTVVEVLQGLAGSHLALMILPMGTSNAFAASLGLSDNYVKIIDSLKSAVVERIDLGRVRKVKDPKNKNDIPGLDKDRFSLLYAGAGPDVFFKKKTGKSPEYKSLNWKAYVDVTQSILMGHLPLYEITVTDVEGNETQVQGNLVIVGNTAVHGGILSLTPSADYTDGVFDVVVFKKGGFGETIKALMTMFKGVPEDGRAGFKCFRAARVEIGVLEGEFGEKVFIDGSQSMKLPVEIECLAGQVSLLKVT